MPIFAIGLMTLVSDLARFLAVFLGVKGARAAAVGLVLTAGWIALQVTMYAMWSALAYNMPVSMQPVVSGILYFLPSNAFTCLTTLVQAKMAVWLWDQQRDYVKQTFA